MKRLIVITAICVLFLGVSFAALAEGGGEKESLEGLHLKMLACGDTAVTRLVNLLDEIRGIDRCQSDRRYVPLSWPY